jgi:hypothetical protein
VECRFVMGRFDTTMMCRHLFIWNGHLLVRSIIPRIAAGGGKPLKNNKQGEELFFSKNSKISDMKMNLELLNYFFPFHIFFCKFFWFIFVHAFSLYMCYIVWDLCHSRECIYYVWDLCHYSECIYYKTRTILCLTNNSKKCVDYFHWIKRYPHL